MSQFAFLIARCRLTSPTTRPLSAAKVLRNYIRMRSDWFTEHMRGLPWGSLLPRDPNHSGRPKSRRLHEVPAEPEQVRLLLWQIRSVLRSRFKRLPVLRRVLHNLCHCFPSELSKLQIRLLSLNHWRGTNYWDVFAEESIKWRHFCSLCQ